MSKPKKSYEVGYRKPPTTTQFQPGKSGNPKGRTKGSKNLTTLYDQIANARIVVTVSGKVRKISKQEAALTQMANKAAAGDLKAIREFIQLGIMLSRDSQAPETEALSETDQNMKERIIQRIKKAATEVDEAISPETADA